MWKIFLRLKRSSFLSVTSAATWRLRSLLGFFGLRAQVAKPEAHHSLYAVILLIVYFCSLG